jgi:ribosome-binding protein aMBF1 (putative translation factor)
MTSAVGVAPESCMLARVGYCQNQNTSRPVPWGPGGPRRTAPRRSAEQRKHHRWLGVRDFRLEAPLSTFSPALLREARIRAGLSHEHVAIAIGRSSYSTREYERGRITPPTDVLGRLADALRIPVGELFTREGGEHAG